jgi:hypothetical protein
MKNRTPNRGAAPKRCAEGGAGTGDQGWRLPCGQTLAEFAIRSGLVAPRLLLADKECPELLGIPLRRTVKG